MFESSTSEMSQQAPPQPTWSSFTAGALQNCYRRICVGTARSTPVRTVTIIRNVLEMPKLTTRRGTREAYHRMPEIAPRLNYVFDLAIGDSRRHIARAILAIWLSMCSDILLCHRLMEADMVDRVLDVVIRDPEGRACALQVLSIVARYDLDTFAMGFPEFIRPLSVLLRIRNGPDVTESTIVTLAHAFERTFLTTTDMNMVPTNILQWLTDSADVVLDLLHRPSPPHALVVHGFIILIHRFRACSWEEISHPRQAPLLNLIASFVRSENIGLCSLCIPSFFDRHPRGHPVPPTFPAPEWTDRNCHLSHSSLRIIDDYGPMRCESARYESAAQAFVKAFEEFMYRDRDLCKLGRKMTSIILNGRYTDIMDDDSMPDIELDELGLPYETWTDCLLAAAEALRNREELDDADTLDLEYLHLTSNSREKLADMCEAVLSRNANHVYALVRLSSCAPKPDKAVSSAKRALEFDVLPPSRRQELRRCLLILMASQAEAILASASPFDRRVQQLSAALLKHSQQYAEVFLSQSPPDNQDVLIVLESQIMTTLVLRGPELSEDFSELQPALQTIKRTAHLLKELGYEIEEHSVTAEWELLLRHSREGMETWGGLIAEMNQREARRRAYLGIPGSDRCTEDMVENVIANGRWRTHCESGLRDFSHNPVKCGCGGDYPSSVLPAPGPGLYKCSYCAKRSALVKVCGRCRNAWYCDETCQSTDWEEHRSECRRPYVHP
ncbi:hypothetical protein C8Q80DRAFT_1173197 [Daedaleopsis nitida]|nr:hypothetical protein C8Q80DRAFT_1173197 [Daedaleopsis nitida]